MINIRTELLYAPNYYWEWLTASGEVGWAGLHQLQTHFWSLLFHHYLFSHLPLRLSVRNPKL
jgi:hypothetical protein